MEKWYAEIDNTGYCFHTTQNELPLSNTILLADEDVLGKVWNGAEWVEPDMADLPLTAEEKQDARDSYMMLLMEN